MVEGQAKQIELFLQTIENNNLPLAHITSIERISLPPINHQDFVIRESVASAERTTLISPNICVCEDCLAEILNPNDRRYRYPFINCANCGPRYTIIENVSYDRPNTSMQRFQMCKNCQMEYEDPTNRRFHAQPNSCPTCKPQVELLNSKRKKVATDDPIRKIINLLKQGYILVFKRLGGFHIAVEAKINESVIRLRQRKN